MKQPKLSKIVINTALGVALCTTSVAIAQEQQQQPVNPTIAPQRGDQIREKQGQNQGQGFGQDQGQGAGQNRQRDLEKQATGQADSDVTKFIQEAAKGGVMEVKMGRMALEKAQSTGVKEFSQTLVSDHTKANQQLSALAQKKGVMLPPEIKGHLSPSDGIAGVNRDAKGTVAAAQDRQPVRDAAAGQDKEQLNRAGGIKTQDDERRLTRDQPRPSAEGHAAGLDPAKHDAAAAMQKMEGLNGAEFDRAFIQHAVMAHEKSVKKYEEAVRTVSDPEVKAFASSTLPTLRQHLQQARGLQTGLPGGEKTGLPATDK